MAGERSQEMREALATPDNIQHVVSDLLAAKVRERLVKIVKGEAETEEQETQPQPEAEAEAEANTESVATE